MTPREAAVRRTDARELAALADKAARLRRHCLRMTTAAGSGHATSSLSAADLVAALFDRVLRFDVAHPHDPRNDRFVLSKGHAAPLLYAAWAEAGAIPVESLRTLRRIDSDLEGHPTPRFPWVELATGSLGQGLPAALGMAIAAHADGHDARIFALLGDGETAEGSVWEAASLAGHRELAHLTAIVDVNRLGQSGPTQLQHDLASYVRRFEAFGWRALAIDGHDLAAILDAYAVALASDRPTAIVARTLKGRGVSFLEDAPNRHGKALDDEELGRALAELGGDGAGPGFSLRAPDGAGGGAPPPGRPPAALPAPDYARGDEVATRSAFGEALRRLGDVDPLVFVIDGDVEDSTRAAGFAEAHPERFVEAYIAEQNAVGMAVGLQALGKRPWFATFACFLTRAYDFVRVAAISRAELRLCGSHAGVSIGPDGPTQMGLEDLAMMRAIPGALVLHPCDAVSTERLVALAARHPGIAYLRTLRPKTPVLYGPDDAFEAGGFQVLRRSERDEIAVLAAGVTVHEALAAHERLAAAGIRARVLDCYCLKPLDADGLAREVAETQGRVVTVEDHYPEGGLGEAVAGALAPEGARVHCLAVREIPRSGTPEELLARGGIDANAIVEAVTALISA